MISSWAGESKEVTTQRNVGQCPGRKQLNQEGHRPGARKIFARKRAANSILYICVREHRMTEAYRSCLPIGFRLAYGHRPGARKIFA